VFCSSSGTKKKNVLYYLTAMEVGPTWEVSSRFMGPLLLNSMLGVMTDDPEAHGRVGAAAADPTRDGVVLVVQRVMVLVVHLPLELWLHGVHQQDGLLVCQWSATWRNSVFYAGHVPLYIVWDRHVVEPTYTYVHTGHFRSAVEIDRGRDRGSW